jgi:hypothetical protein
MGGLRQFGLGCRKWRSGCRKCRFAALRLPFFRSAVSQLRQLPGIVTDRDLALALGFRRFAVTRIRGDGIVSLKRPFPMEGGRGATLAASRLLALACASPVQGFSLFDASPVWTAASRVGLAARPEHG